MKKPILKRPKRKVLSLDPGIDFGWALWPNKQRWLHGTLPDKAGVVNTHREADWDVRFLEVCKWLHFCLSENQISDIVAEVPVFFNTTGGKAIAAKGDLGKLYQVVGAFRAISLLNGVVFHDADVLIWKGQLPKRVVCDRIQEAFGKDACADLLSKRNAKGEGSHDWDAVGVGLWAKGKF